MDATTFEELGLQEQVDLVCEQGQYLSYRKTEGYLITLYQLQSFYAELFFIQEETELVQIRAYSASSLPEFYLPPIDFLALLEKGS